MIIISYATAKTPYETIIKEKLIPTLEKWKLKYDIVYPEDGGSWQVNTHMKAQIIKDALLKYKESVCFIDSDATIENYPDLLFQLEDYDISYHELDWCYSEDTEILTETGWKYFYNLQKNDKIATLNLKTQYLEYQKFINFRCYPYRGKMYNFKHQSINLLVHPNHNMIYIKDFGNKIYDKNHIIESELAHILYNNQRFKIPRICKWKGQSIKYFYLPSYDNIYGKDNNFHDHRNKIKIPIKLWIKFLGWYLTEGCVTFSGSVSIAQSPKSSYCKEIKKIVSQISTYLNCNYNIYTKHDTMNNFYICSIQLATYLKQFGKSHDKFIPNYIKQLPTNLLKLFINTYIKGDGCEYQHKKRKHISQSIFTSSLQMKKDLEEIIFKVGLTYNSKKQLSGFGHWIYAITIRHLPHISIRKNHKSIIHYKGNIYSIEVPNNTVYVRRGIGTQCWSGNCKMWRKQEGNPKREVLSGTLFINYTPNALAFLDAWIAENNKSKDWEQRNMEKIIEIWKNKLQIYPLPYSYITIIYKDGKIPTHMIQPSDVVILHHQASRQLRNWHKEKK